MNNMQEEIKEMIDKIKKCLIAGYDLDIITQEEMGILWNYITNLQEENKRLNNIIDGMEKYINEVNNMITTGDIKENMYICGRYDENLDILNKFKELKGDNK